MKPHPTPHRIRKTIKWGGAAVTVLLVVVWVAGMRFSARLGPSSQLLHGFLGVNTGRLDIGYVLPPIGSTQLPEFFAYRPRWECSLAPDLSLSGPVRYLVIPLWIPAVVMITAIAAVWRKDAMLGHNERANLCPTCEYDRTGLRDGANAKCPECGSGGPPA